MRFVIKGWAEWEADNFEDALLKLSRHFGMAAIDPKYRTTDGVFTRGI